MQTVLLAPGIEAALMDPYHHGPGKDRRPVNRLNSQPENKLHHVLGHYQQAPSEGLFIGSR